MNISQLEKLAQNPHYKLSASQLAELEAAKKGNVKHKAGFKIHPTKPKEES